MVEYVWVANRWGCSPLIIIATTDSHFCWPAPPCVPPLRTKSRSWRTFGVCLFCLDCGMPCPHKFSSQAAMAQRLSRNSTPPAPVFVALPLFRALRRGPDLHLHRAGADLGQPVQVPALLLARPHPTVPRQEPVRKGSDAQNVLWVVGSGLWVVGCGLWVAVVAAAVVVNFSFFLGGGWWLRTGTQASCARGQPRNHTTSSPTIALPST